MRSIIKIIIILLFCMNLSAREKGETEITTEDGIEVFQNEKYYLLKKNVEIESDNFILKANNVKINFENSLYDIIELNAEGNVEFNSPEFNIKGSGDNLQFEVKIEKLKVKGINSKVVTEEIEMFSDGSIEINNLTGKFSVKGKNSKLINETVFITGESINGIFSNNNGKKEVTFLNVVDENISYVKNNDTEMYAKKINFDNEISIIELVDSVTIIRNEEKITGDYGTLDTNNNSYKIKSNNLGKVKVIIQDDE